MEFREWMKIKEEAAPASAPSASAASSTPSAPPASSPTITSASNSSGGTTTGDVAKVPQRMFSNKRQTSDKCQNCSKDFWKNWYYTKKKRKK